MSFLRQPARVVAADRHPHVQFIVDALDASPEVRAPEFILAGNVAQRLEGNGYLDDPTIVRHAALRFHYDVRIEIFAVVGPTAIGLYPERIEIKLIGFAPVV